MNISKKYLKEICEGVIKYEHHTSYAEILKLALKDNLESCEKYKGNKYENCRKKAYEHVISLAKGALSRCDQSQNPKRCKSELTKEIKKMETQVKKWEE